MNCVWDTYFKELEAYKEQEKLLQQAIEKEEGDDRTEQSATKEVKQGSLDDDPSTKAFLELERKLQQKNE